MDWRDSLAPEFDPPPMDDEPPAPPPRSRRQAPNRREATRTKGKTGDRFATINAFVDASLARLHPADALVWLVLWRDTEPDGLARPSQAYIARRVGVSTRTVKRSVKRLRDEGLVTIVCGGGLNRGSTVYRVHPVGRSPQGT